METTVIDSCHIFSLCINSTPDNDEPNGAQMLAINSGTCNFTTLGINNINSTLSSCGTIPAPGCAGLSGTATDVWFSVTIPASGNVFIQTQQGTTAPAMSDAGMATYTGTPCGVLTLINCSDSTLNGQNSANMPGLYVSGQTLGTIVYIRVWNKDTKTKGFFKICATDMGPCGNLANNDFCSNPASMTPSSTGSFVSTTTASGTYSYTTDAPGNLINAAVCSNGLSQNSWSSFIATTAPTQTFAFNISGCAGGLTAQVFSVTTQNGCCKSFTSVGSCLGNSVTLVGVTGPQTLTASGLTNGVQYYVMVESATSGQVCTYSITGWTATGVLPIELISLTATNKGDVNYIEWITASEENNDYFTIERSTNGIEFEKVSDIKAYGNGNSTKRQFYHTYDSNPNKELTYYRLIEVDLFGHSKISKIISVFGPDFYETIYNLYPNPTTNNLNFEYYSKSINSIYIELIGYRGNIVRTNVYSLEEGLNVFSLPMTDLDNGVYILKVVSEKSGKTTHHKIIKN